MASAENKDISSLSLAAIDAALGHDVAAAISSLAEGVRATSRSHAERSALENVARKLGVKAFCEHRLKVIACAVGPRVLAAADTTWEKAEATRLRINLIMKASMRRRDNRAD